MRRLIPIILLLAFLTACRDAPGPDAIDTAPAVTQTEQVTITLAVEGSSLNRYRPLIEAFQQENPHIRVRLVNTGEVADPDESGIRALATSFDVFPYSPNRQGESQYLLDLRPLLDLDPQFEPADFLPGLLPPPLEPLWAIPIGAAYYLTFYDQSAFDDAGRPHPDLDWTTDDFLDAALALTVREGDEVTRWGYVPGQLRYPPLLASQLAGPMTTPDGGLRLADPDVVAAVQWLSDLFTLHEVSPWLEEYKPVERRSDSGGQTASVLINSGQAAMWHFTHLLFDASDENVGITAVPQGENGLAAEPILYGFAASRGTAHPEAAWQLLHFLSRQPSQDLSMFPLALVPARRSVAAVNSYWEQLPDNLAPALQYTAENNTTPRLSYQAIDALQEALAAHIDDNIPVLAALDQSAEIAPIPPEETEVEVIMVPNVEPEDEEERVQITFATDRSVVEAHRRLANQFQEEQSDIAVRFLEIDAYTADAINQIADSDCFVGNAQSWQDEERRMNLLPLTPLLELDGDLDSDEFYPVLLESLMIDGQLWGLPAWIHAPSLEYNRELFAEAGIPDPPLDWTLDDFLDIALQVTTGEGETKQYGYTEAGLFFALGFTQAFGVQVVDDSAEVPHFNYEAATEMIAWYVDLFRVHQVQAFVGEGSVADFNELENLIRSGRLAVWPGGFSRFIETFGGIPLHFEVGAAAVPIGPGGYRGEISHIATATFAYYITADSSNRQACWEWLKFLTRQPTAVQVQGTSARMMPAHIEASESEAYISFIGADLAAVIRDFMNIPPVDNAVTITPSPPWMGPGYDWLRDAYREAVSGEVSVTAALAEAEAKFSQYRQCIIERDGLDDSAAWSLCAAEAER
jgi:multiple sugar transport system substrate-binding protein